jgi:hypothetical protein
MTAVVISLAADRAWITTDGLCLNPDGTVGECGPKFLIFNDGWCLAGSGNVGDLTRFADRRAPDAAAFIEGAGAWLRNAGVRLTAFLVRAGAGWCWSYEDGYEQHQLQVGRHSARPAVPAFTYADPFADVAAFHYAYLRAAAAAEIQDMPAPIGGKAWHVELPRGELVELGPLP